MKSIQRRLLVGLAAGLGATIAVVALATYGFAYSQISAVYDEELLLVAEAVHLGEDWRGPARVRIPRQGFNLSVRAYDRAGTPYFETVEPMMPPDLPRLFEAGYRVIETRAGEWRVYTHVTPDGIVQVGQPDATRTALARALSVRMTLPELLLAPLFVLFPAWMVRRGFAPVNDLSRRVEQRDAARLDSLPSDQVPQELVPLVRQINGLLARLAGSMAAQRQFVADAAHELRTPVAALALQAQVAERTSQQEARAAAFAELHRGIARAGRVVEQLLRLAQVSPEAAQQQPALIDVAEIAREVVGSMAYRARQGGIDLGAEADGKATLWGDKAELVSLISNLVDNSLRYAPPQSEVTVRVRSDAQGVDLCVVDQGPGIPAVERERVFERFKRAAGDETRGVGLGLAIVKAIVERHGGTIELADARPGACPPGLAAHVRFPARPA